MDPKWGLSPIFVFLSGEELNPPKGSVPCGGACCGEPSPGGLVHDPLCQEKPPLRRARNCKMLKFLDDFFLGSPETIT